ncbi:efflux RND transporter permease subunit [bacterium]|nr:efflux RND transporter permease subunit [bacterium]
MNRAITWFVENRVVANLLMVVIIAAGLISLSQITIEVFPEFDSDNVSVTVSYLGAAPEEVEEGVCIRIEEAIQDLEGIKKIRSTASEGAGRVLVEVKAGYDTRKLLDDIKARIDGINTFPEETEKPVIQEILLRFQVINVAISGNADERSLKLLGERVREDLLAIPEISQVDLSATRPYEISIEVAEEALRRYGLTFDEVAQAVRRTSLDLPGGSIRTSGGQISLRTKGQAYRGEEFDKLILRSFADGTRLRLGNVASIRDGFAETDQSARFDGEPCVLVQVFRVGDESALEVAAAVKKYVSEMQASMPEGIQLTTWQDDTLILRDRLNLLLRNGRAGFFLVFLCLALFLRLRLSWWVVVGMVISFFGAFWVMPGFDVSINLLSLFAFILVLGIVVDDAIVVGENIYKHLENGKSSLRAAIEGTKEVAMPVAFAVMTTVAAFSPLLNVPGRMGKFMKVIPIIVIATLVFSLIESLFILPAHLSHVGLPSARASNRGLRNRWRRFQEAFASSLRDFAQNHYRRFLDLALTWRYTSVAVGVGTLLLTLGMVGGGWVKFNFFPDVEADNTVALLTMPAGTSVEVTSETVERLEKSAIQLRDELSAQGVEAIGHILASVGEQPFRVRQSIDPTSLLGTGGAHLGEVNLQLVSAERREITASELAKRWRQLTGEVPEAEELVFSTAILSAGDPINIQLSGTNYEELRRASEALKSRIAKYSGIFDINDSFREGMKEIKLEITPQAEALGLTLSDLARQVRQAFYGEEAQRIQRGRDDIRVMVRYPEASRKSLKDLENMRVRLPDNAEVPFSVAGKAVEGRGYASIARTDRRRTINITADLDLNQANANEIIADITQNVMPGLLAEFPGIRYSLEGEQSEQQETLAGLGRGLFFALLLIFVLLAMPFRSYLQPLIVMSAIPFGLVGAVWGHIIMGKNLTILSGFGIVALTGVVVNDSLVMVDFVNRARKRGLPLLEAIKEAGVSRFRPILLTSLTTFAGLTPLLLEKSLQAQFLIPMAISLAFGVVFATVITLIIVPCLYWILEDLRVGVTRLAARGMRIRRAFVDAQAPRQ